MATNDINPRKKIPFWWSIPSEALRHTLKTDTHSGLSVDEIEQNRLAFGSNILEEVKPISVKNLIFESVQEPMMVLLLSIALLSLFFGRAVEASVMVFVVAAYVSVECINKFRSDRTLTALRALTEPVTKVLRSGKHIEVPTADMVVGDIVILSEGARVPADLRLIESLA